MLCACLGIACDESSPPDPTAQATPRGRTPGPATVPDDSAAFAMSIAALEVAYRAAAEAAREGEASVAGVVAGRDAGRLARVLALRTEDGEVWLERAREHLTEASRRKALEGACEAALDLARLEARDAGDHGRAYAVAYRTVRRFEGDDHQACLLSARRFSSVLEAFRPGPDVLSVIDADPDSNDPTVLALDDSVETSPSEAGDVAAWAEQRGDLTDARLEEVIVYGSHAPGEDDGAVVRVVLRFDHVAVFERGEIPAERGMPRRAYLDLARTSLSEDVAAATPVNAAGLVRVRASAFEPGASRVVFDLSGDAEYGLFFLTDPYRIVVDFHRPKAREPVATRDTAPLVETVVLDPGHGGNEFGARYDNLRESHLTLDITERVEAALRRRMPRLRVLLTRRRDEVVSLEQRVAFANARSADLFVSIHLNAANEPVDRGGVATFVLDTTNDRQALRLAARENNTTTREVTGLQRVLASVHREGQLSESRRLAELVQLGTLAGGRRHIPGLPDRGVKSAMFYVLVGARMPAVLLEASFLTHPEEARALATADYRQALAEGVAEGIVRYARGL